MRMRARPLGMVDEPPETRLLLELAKEAFRQQVAKRVRPLARSYVERWMGCELWLYPSVIQRHQLAVLYQALLPCQCLEIFRILASLGPDVVYVCFVCHRFALAPVRAVEARPALKSRVSGPRSRRFPHRSSL